jgi:hypothetical protein
MKIRTVAAGGVAVLLALATAACSSSTPGTPPITRGDSPGGNLIASQGPVSPTVTTPATATATAPNLRNMILRVRDLPTGWAVDNSDDDDDSSGNFCGSSKDIGGDATAHKDASFAYQGNVPFLEESVGYFANGATQSTTGAIKALDKCEKLSFTSDGKKISGTLGTMSFPKFGDQSAAWDATLSYEGINIGISLVVFRKGNIVALLILGDVGAPDVDQLTALTKRAAAKI